MITELALWILAGATSVLGILWGLLVAIGSWVWRRQIDRVDQLRDRIDAVERDQAVHSSRLENVPTLEKIREVIREEIALAGLRPQ